MARQEVVQVQCDRCKRVSLRFPGPPKETPDLQATFGDKTLLYQDLCAPCVSAIETAWPLLCEWERKSVQTLLPGPTVPNNQAPPMSVAPDYSPPKPHSAAGAKRS